MNESFNIAPGGAAESYQPRNKINQIYGVWVDNFSGGWLGIEGRNLWVPPYTRGWKAGIFPGMSSITIRSYDFANGIRIAGATGQAAIVTLWDADKGDSEGIAFFDQQTIPLYYVQQRNADNSTYWSLLAAPAVGRYRIYDIRFAYAAGNIGLETQGLTCQIYNTISPLPIANMTISPASPESTITLTNPGSDAPIGAGIKYILLTTDVLQIVEQPFTDVAIRYAVI